MQPNQRRVLNASMEQKMFDGTRRFSQFVKDSTRAGDREVAGRVEDGLEAGSFVLRECVHQRLKTEFEQTTKRSIDKTIIEESG